MVLNYIWIGLILIGVVVGLVHWILTGQAEVFNEMLLRWLMNHRDPEFQRVQPDVQSE